MTLIRSEGVDIHFRIVLDLHRERTRHFGRQISVITKWGGAWGRGSVCASSGEWASGRSIFNITTIDAFGGCIV
jgi:hypothetical protein